ncbi:DUF4872 domain-containing protein [Streptomyces sp. NPDC056254]|uniref:DUF4872 domain-containing protein n=1 Tax=Streptomyces sp. NPDC056254 TaxID=3345763 RepID=UPI0035DC1E53
MARRPGRDGRSRSVHRGPRRVRGRFPVRRGRRRVAVPDRRGGVRRRLVRAPQGAPRDDRAHRPRRRGARRRGSATAARLTGPVLGNKFDVNFGFSGMEKFAAQLRDTRTKAGWERRFAAPDAFRAGTRRLYACLEEEWTAPGATRPLYADFLDLAGRQRAAELFRESGGHWSRLAGLARAAAADAAPEADAAPDPAVRRALLDEFATLVEQSVALERRAVTLL